MSTSAIENVDPVHPDAARVAKAIVYAQAGEESAISPKDMKAFTLELRDRVSEQELFIHLCVLAHRLKQGGLEVAANQLVSLARIGLAPEKVEQALEQARQNAAALQGPARRSASDKGIAAPTARGVGIGPRKPAKR